MHDVTHATATAAGAARIAPLEPPFTPEVSQRLSAMMGGVDLPPLALFRTFVRNFPMAVAMGRWGGHTLGPSSTLDIRTRELIIWRVCARHGCEYEWGVHVSAFSEAAGLGPQHAAASLRSADDPVWSEDDQLVVRVVDELHTTSTVSDKLWAALRARWSEEQLLDMLMLAGWYHAIVYVANAARVALEPWAARFASAG